MLAGYPVSNGCPGIKYYPKIIFKNVANLGVQKNLQFFFQHNDVAILTLEDDVQYSSTIQPICLASGSNTFYNNM